MRKLLLGLFCLASVLQATDLTGTLQGPDGPGINGILWLSLSQQGALMSTGGCGGPIELVPGAGGNNGYRVRVPVVSGVLQGMPHVFGNDCILPGNTYYNISVVDNNGNTFFTDKWVITGASVDIGTIVSAVISGTTQTLGSTGFIMSVTSSNQVVTQGAGTSLSVNFLAATGTFTLPNGAVCDVSGCPGLISNAVLTSGNQNVTGNKTFTNTIAVDVATGNALTANNSGVGHAGAFSSSGASSTLLVNNGGAGYGIEAQSAGVGIWVMSTGSTGLQASSTGGLAAEFGLLGGGVQIDNGLAVNGLTFLNNVGTTLRVDHAGTGNAISVNDTGIGHGIDVLSTATTSAIYVLQSGSGGGGDFNTSGTGTGVQGSSTGGGFAAELGLYGGAAVVYNDLINPGIGTNCSGKADGTYWNNAGTVTVCPSAGGPGGGTITALTGDVTASGSGAVAATVVKVNGIAYSATAALHSVEVITVADATATAKVIPDCTDTAGNHINFTQSTDAFSCGTTVAGITALTGDGTASGTGSVALTVVKVNGVAYGTSPSTNTVPVVTGTNTITYEQVPNAALANTIITVNGTTCTLGSSCSPSGSGGITSLTGDVTATGPGASAATVAKVNGIAYSATAAAHTIEVITTANTAATAKTMPDCTDTAGNHINFAQSTDAFSCGTSVPTGTTSTIASGTSALGTSAISSATCATVVTTSATGTATTDNIQADFNADPTGVTGYVPSTSGILTIIKYPTLNNVNFKVCNNTSGSITPGAITLNWRVVR